MKIPENYWIINSEIIIPKLLREIAQEITPNLIFQASALNNLQEATESYIVGLIEDSNLYAIHAKCITIMPRDMHLACEIREEKSEICYRELLRQRLFSYKEVVYL